MTEKMYSSSITRCGALRPFFQTATRVNVSKMGAFQQVGALPEEHVIYFDVSSSLSFLPTTVAKSLNFFVGWWPYSSLSSYPNRGSFGMVFCSWA